MTDPRNDGPGPHDPEYRRDLIVATRVKNDAVKAEADAAVAAFRGATKGPASLNANLEIARARSEIEAVLREGEERLDKLSRPHAEAEAEAVAFRTKARLDPLAPTAYAVSSLSALPLLVVFLVLLGLETILTAWQIAPDLKGGFPQALATAAPVGLMLCICAAAAGMIGVRSLRHRELKQKAIGLAALTVSGAVALLVIGGMARMRFTGDAGAEPGAHLAIAVLLSAFQIVAFLAAAVKFSGGKGMPWTGYPGEAGAHRPLHRIGAQIDRIIEEMCAAINALINAGIAQAEALYAAHLQARANASKEAEKLELTLLRLRREARDIRLDAENNWREYVATWHAKRPCDLLVAAAFEEPEFEPIEGLIADACVRAEKSVQRAERELVDFRWIAEKLRVESLQRAKKLAPKARPTVQTKETQETQSDSGPRKPPDSPPSAGAKGWLTRLLPRGRS